VPAGTELPVPTRDPEEVRDLADRILARPEFGDQRSLVERAEDWITERLGDLANDLVGGAGSDAVGWAVVAVLTAASLILAVRYTRRVQRDPGAAPAAVDVRHRPAHDWRADAEAHERAGAWRSALRCRYRALVAELDRSGVVEEVPGRTAGEYRRQVGASAPEVAGMFGAATSLFESAWYGNRPTGPGEAAQFRSLAAGVEGGVRRR
jgi:hypothetical protein